VIELNSSELVFVCIINAWIFLLILPSLFKKMVRDYYSEKFLHEVCKKQCEKKE